MLVGFVGRRRAGKDTAAAALAAEGFKVVRFAEGLKTMLAALLRLHDVSEARIERMIEGDLKEFPSDVLDGQTCRFAMQTLGTEWGREHMGRNFWVRTTLQRALSYQDAAIADVRFPNEADAIHKAGGTLIRIVRGENQAADTHPSETLMDDIKCDFEVDNNGPVSQLNSLVRLIVNNLKALPEVEFWTR